MHGRMANRLQSSYLSEWIGESICPLITRAWLSTTSDGISQHAKALGWSGLRPAGSLRHRNRTTGGPFGFAYRWIFFGAPLALETSRRSTDSSEGGQHQIPDPSSATSTGSQRTGLTEPWTILDFGINYICGRIPETPKTYDSSGDSSLSWWELHGEAATDQFPALEPLDISS